MRTTVRTHLVGFVAILCLVLVLALSACGARGQNQGALGGSTSTSGGTGQTTPQQSGQDGVSTANLQAVESTDQSVQDAINAMNSAATDAGQNFASQENEAQP